MPKLTKLRAKRSAKMLAVGGIERTVAQPMIRALEGDDAWLADKKMSCRKELLLAPLAKGNLRSLMAQVRDLAPSERSSAFIRVPPPKGK